MLRRRCCKDGMVLEEAGGLTGFFLAFEGGGREGFSSIRDFYLGVRVLAYLILDFAHLSNARPLSPELKYPATILR
jgi:hypothetical protein